MIIQIPDSGSGGSGDCDDDGGCVMMNGDAGNDDCDDE